MPWLARFRKTKSHPVATARKDSGYTSSSADGEHTVYRSGKVKYDSEPAMSSDPGKQKPVSDEPKLPAIVPPTPAAVHEAYEAAASPRSVSRPDENGVRKGLRTAPLSDDELKYIFSGAPHFILEKGARSQWYPLALFPWDESNLIQNLRDRRPLYTSAFSLATLHAHLPPFSEHSSIYSHSGDKSEMKIQQPTPAFDIEVFEVPDMLSSRAKECGCVGYCYFLESAIALPFRSSSPMSHKPHFEKDVSGALRSGASTEPYADCTPFAELDRLKIIKDGTNAWRRLGIRDCSVRCIAERMQTLQNLRGKMINPIESMSLLDWQTTPALYNQLFATFLYPPPEGQKATAAPDTYSLKTQITVLIRVLSVRGAWIDFSGMEWRLRLGQVLWEVTPHRDGDCIIIDDTADEYSPGADAERKWLLLQILLTAELGLRIDAAVKLGITRTSQSTLQVTAQDVHQINTLRTEKLDWDIISCRRLLDNFTFQYLPKADRCATPSLETSHKPRTRRIRERIGLHKKLSVNEAGESAWDCLILPRFPYRQLDGLFYFAEDLKWPDVEAFKARMKGILDTATSSFANMAREFASPLSTNPLPPGRRQLDRSDMYGEHRSSRLAQLQASSPPPPPPPPTRNEEPDDKSLTPAIRGWTSRTWLSGLVLPGDSLGGLLMCTLLENDSDAMRRLGQIANLYGGFVYNGRSWWSTMTIVGRILASLEGSNVCVGWIATDVVPRDKNGNPFSDGWFEIQTQDDPQRSNMPRINQGNKVFLESSPVGIGSGELSSQTFSLPLDGSDSGSPDMRVTFEKMTLLDADRQRSSDRSTSHLPFKATASAAYAVVEPGGASTTARFILRYNVQFISSYTCLPPPGHVTRFDDRRCKPQVRRQYRPLFEKSNEGTDLVAFADQTERGDDIESANPDSDARASRRRYRLPPRLPGHPLHTPSYPHSYIPLSSLPTMATLPTPPGDVARQSHHSQWPHPRRRTPKHTFILDARGSKDKESFARAWCAAVGTNAVVGRVGRTCLACCIREARAVDVLVVIRVGLLETGN